MKHSFYLPVMIFIIFSLFSFACKKDPTRNAKLPPATREGKNTAGFTINNEVWVPYYKCRFSGDPCGEISARYGESGGAAANSFDLQIARQRSDKLSVLTISSSGRGTITTVGNKIDSIGVNFEDERSNGTDNSYSGIAYGSKFIITKIDSINQIISGEFELLLREDNSSGKIIILNDGRFDFKLNACKCSK